MQDDIGLGVDGIDLRLDISRQPIKPGLELFGVSALDLVLVRCVFRPRSCPRRRKRPRPLRLGPTCRHVLPVYVCPCYAYALSAGLFAGISMEGVVLNELSAVNTAFYGKAIEGRLILDGSADLPGALPAVASLHAALAAMDASLNGTASQ